MQYGTTLTVIVTTFNSERFIKSCLDSILAQDYSNIELIVVDNNSQDLTNQILSGFEKIKVIKNIKNYGVCFARNQALKEVSSKYVLVLDSDMILKENFISQIISFAESSPSDVGMWGGAILSMKNPELIDSLGLILTNFYRFYDYGKAREFTHFKVDNSLILGPCACAALYKKEMLEEIKNAPHEYFDSQMHYLIEDFDIALRAREKGWKFKYVPGAIGYHYRHGSNLDKKYIQYLSFRNRYYLIWKFFKLRNIPFFFLSFFIYDLPRLVFLLFINYSYTKLALKEVFERMWINKK